MGKETDEPIPDYLPLAVIATIGCFPFTGLPAILAASRARTLQEAGDRDGARDAARRARRWIVWSVALGAALVLGTIALVVAGGLWILQLAEQGRF